MRWGPRRVLPLLALIALATACGTKQPPPTAVAPVVQKGPPPSMVATATVASVPVYSAPGGTGSPIHTLSNPFDIGNNNNFPLVFLVDATQGAWLKVDLPIRPNESTGWIRASDVTLSQDPMRVMVQLSQHKLTVFKGASIVDTIPVAVGAPSGPTPTGHYYVTQVIPVPANQPFFGPYAFGLSAFSGVYASFSGGPGQTAMHGTDQPNLIGQNISHGCIRMTNASASRLHTEMPVGTPVVITA
ncbi:MAG: L,D-transpeptidase [Acidimicrobiales bacterium]